MPALTMRSLLRNYDPSGWVHETFPGTVVGRELGRLVPAVRKEAICGLLTEQIETLLELNLIELIVAAWLRTESLSALASGAAAELVALVDHRISSSHEPRVEVCVNGAPVATVQVRVSLELQFQGAQLLLRDGRVREVRVGELRSAGVLEIEGHELTRQPFAQIPLPGVLKLDPGLGLT